MPTLPDTAFGRFVLVDQVAGVATLRPSGAQLAPSRAPRPTLELLADGTCVRGIPGPADSRVQLTGTFVERSDGALVMTWDDGAPETVVEIIASDSETLELRVLSGSLTAPPVDPGGP